MTSPILTAEPQPYIDRGLEVLGPDDDGIFMVIPLGLGVDDGKRRLPDGFHPDATLPPDPAGPDLSQYRPGTVIAGNKARRRIRRYLQSPLVRRMNMVSRKHFQWMRDNAAAADALFQPRGPGSDYNLHTLDVEATFDPFGPNPPVEFGTPSFVARAAANTAKTQHRCPQGLVSGGQFTGPFAVNCEVAPAQFEVLTNRLAAPLVDLVNGYPTAEAKEAVRAQIQQMNPAELYALVDWANDTRFMSAEQAGGREFLELARLGRSEALTRIGHMTLEEQAFLPIPLTGEPGAPVPTSSAELVALEHEANQEAISVGNRQAVQDVAAMRRNSLQGQVREAQQAERLALSERVVQSRDFAEADAAAAPLRSQDPSENPELMIRQIQQGDGRAHVYTDEQLAQAEAELTARSENEALPHYTRNDARSVRDTVRAEIEGRARFAETDTDTLRTISTTDPGYQAAADELRSRVYAQSGPIALMTGQEMVAEANRLTELQTDPGLLEVEQAAIEGRVSTLHGVIETRARNHMSDRRMTMARSLTPMTNPELVDQRAALQRQAGDDYQTDEFLGLVDEELNRRNYVIPSERFGPTGEILTAAELENFSRSAVEKTRRIGWADTREELLRTRGPDKVILPPDVGEGSALDAGAMLFVDDHGPVRARDIAATMTDMTFADEDLARLAFQHNDLGGTEISSVITMFMSNEERNYTAIQGVFNDSNGIEVGKWNGLAAMVGDGEWRVHASYMRLDSGMQGLGVAGDFMYRAENAMIANGVTTMTVNANIDVGGYAWAVGGFEIDPDSDGAMQLVNRAESLLGNVTSDDLAYELDSLADDAWSNFRYSDDADEQDRYVRTLTDLHPTDTFNVKRPPEPDWESAYEVAYEDVTREIEIQAQERELGEGQLFPLADVDISRGDFDRRVSELADDIHEDNRNEYQDAINDWRDEVENFYHGVSSALTSGDLDRDDLESIADRVGLYYDSPYSDEEYEGPQNEALWRTIANGEFNSVLEIVTAAGGKEFLLNSGWDGIKYLGYSPFTGAGSGYVRGTGAQSISERLTRLRDRQREAFNEGRVSGIEETLKILETSDSFLDDLPTQEAAVSPGIRYVSRFAAARKPPARCPKGIRSGGEFTGPFADNCAVSESEARLLVESIGPDGEAIPAEMSPAEMAAVLDLPDLGDELRDQVMVEFLQLSREELAFVPGEATGDPTELGLDGADFDRKVESRSEADAEAYATRRFADLENRLGDYDFENLLIDHNGEKFPLSNEDAYAFQEELYDIRQVADDAGLDLDGDIDDLESQFTDAAYLAGWVDENLEFTIPSPKTETWGEIKPAELALAEAAERFDTMRAVEAEQLVMAEWSRIGSNVLVGEDDPDGMKGQLGVDDPDVVGAQVAEELRGFLSDNNPAMFIDAEDLDAVLTDGEFYPWHHGDITSSNSVTTNRDDIEAFSMGLDYDADWRDRPVYTTFDKNYTGEPIEEANSIVSYFGDSKVVFKDDLKDRMTLTVGDSGDSSVGYPVPVSVRGIELGEERPTSLVLGAVSPGNVSSQTAEWMRDPPDGDGDLHGRQIVRSIANETWIEGQAWGGITTGDIDRVVFSTRGIGTDHIEAQRRSATVRRVIRKLEDAGIPWSYSDDPWNDEDEF